MSRTVPIAAFVLLAWLLPRSGGEPAPLSPDREVASLLPERCSVYLEGTRTLALLEQGLVHPFVHALETTALGAALTTALPRSPRQALEVADEWLGRPLLPSLAVLTSRGVGLGFDPESKKTVLVALGRDAESVADELTIVFDAVERQFGLPGALDEPLQHVAGADLWALGDAFVARREALLVLGNERELVTEVLDLAADPTASGLFRRPGFSAHHASKPESSTLWAWLELAEIEPHADQGFRDLRAANKTPAVQGLLGARIGALLAARALSVALSLADDSLELELRAFEPHYLGDLAPLARGGEVPAELDGEGVAEALLYRDYGRFLARRAELFPPEVLPGFAEVITNGALFFEGKDLGEEVLPHLSPWIRLVSRELEFDAQRRPEIPLPGVALVAVLEDERQGEPWIAAFQTIISLINVDQAQKGGKSLRLHLGSEGEVEISSARFATPDPGDGVDMRYNLEPTLAVVGRHLVLGTHAALVRQLVRELGQASPTSPPGGRETLAVAARGLRAIVDQNFELLVAKKMVTDGLERAAAEKEIEGLRLALSSFEGARLEVGGDGPDASDLRLELRLAPAASPR